MILHATYTDALEGIGHSNPAPLPPRWKARKWTQAAAKYISEKRPRPAFYKITEGADTWVLDDVARGAVGDDLACCQYGTLTSQESLERLKLLFRLLGIDDRLEIRENPEWATPYKSSNALAGVRAGRAWK
jgi:hypothetical protein